MQCERLISLVKNWYLRVQEEAMAPARMVAFIEQHISQCEVCGADPDVKEEAEKIREIVLPPSKVPKPKVVRAPKEDVEEKETDKAKDAEEAEAEDEVDEAETEDDVDEADTEDDVDEADDDIDEEDELEPNEPDELDDNLI